jgi:hypothetical protein
MSNVNGLFARGKTFNWGTTDTLTSSYGQSVGLEGHVGVFKDEVVSTGGIKTLRSDRLQKCMIVRNVSGISLLPRQLVQWKSGYIGKRVGGYACTTNAQIAGVVDERLPSTGVPNHDLFWLQVQGPCLVNSSYAAIADVTAGDPLTAITCSATTAATVSTTNSGRAQKLVGGAGTTATGAEVLAVQLGLFAKAISGCTSTGTNTGFLADLDCMNI